MKTEISAAIRRFIEQNIVADDPLPERSWLDKQDMPRSQESRRVEAGLPVQPLLPLHCHEAGHGRRHRQRLRRTIRWHANAHREDGL